MEKKFDHRNTDDLPSQSYCAGIEKIAAVKNASCNNFQVPQNTLEERKKAWNDLFEKYSAMVSGVELNVHTLKPEGEMNLFKTTEKRLPMRKSMSMVQYWVETGNFAHTNCTINPLGLVSESSKVDNNLELTRNVYSPSLITGSGAEKYSNFAKTSENKNTSIVTASNSSIDTAAYILANNYVTKKLETIAIVKGSKVNSEIQSHIKNYPEILEIAKSKHYISLANKNHFNKINMENINSSKPILFTSYVDKITENMKNADSDKKCSSKMMSMPEQQENRICSIFLSDSEESQAPNFENHKNSNKDIRNNLSKAIKRKKLYKRSDSPADFTPVSEDNLSFKTSRFMTEKCLPLRFSEHPALETPKVSSRFLARTKFRKAKSKRKLDQDQGFSSVSRNNSISISHEKLYPSNKNNSIKLTSYKHCPTISNLIANQTISKDEFIRKNNFHKSMNSMRQSYLNQSNKIDKAFVCMANTLSSSDNILEPRLKLKSCQVVVQRLPYKYYLPSSSEQITKNNKSFGIMKYCICTQDLTKNTLNYVFKSNITTKNASSSTYLGKNLPENTADFKTHNFKRFGDTHIVQDKLGYKRKQSKSPEKKSSIYSLDRFEVPDIKESASNIYPIKEILTKHSQKKNEENLCKIKAKYMIADSSSDESDLIVPLSINKNQLESKSSNPIKLSSISLSHQIPKSKSKIVGSFTTIENYKNVNLLTYDDSSNNFSKEKKRSSENLFENYKIDNDMQYNKVEENVYLDTNECDMLPRNYPKQKYKVKNTSFISFSSKKKKEKSIPTRKQLKTLNLASECKQSAKSTHATFSKYKNTSNSKIGEHILLHEIHKINNKENINKKSSKIISVHDKLNIFDNTSNKKEKQESHTSLNDSNAETLFEFLPISANSYEPPFTCSNANEDSIKNEKNELSKPTQQRGSKANIKGLVQIASMVTPKTSIKKRSSFEIELSSDEECIMPLKKI